MRTSSFADVVYTHTEGEPTCIVHGGILYPHGTDIWAKRRYLEENYDWLRRALMREPRGHKHMFGVFLTPPSAPDTHGGMIWMDGERFHDMCGHGTIALAMVLVANQLVPGGGAVSKLRLETTTGIVEAEVTTRNGVVESAGFINVPAFVVESSVPVTLDGTGEATADIAFGGNFFGQVEWTGREPAITFESLEHFSALGVALKDQLRKAVSVRHPLYSEIDEINFVTFYEQRASDPLRYRVLHVFSDGKVDRSPGGTGTSALLATLEHRGRVRLGQTVMTEGPLGTGAFKASLIDVTHIGNRRTLIPEIRGTAQIIGYARWMFEEEDPLRHGISAA